MVGQAFDKISVVLCYGKNKKNKKYLFITDENIIKIHLIVFISVKLKLFLSSFNFNTRKVSNYYYYY